MTADRTVQRLVHVTRLPPSPSGVAAYAQAFRPVLEELGDVDVERLPPDPAASQSAVLALRLARRLARRAPSDVLVVEQAGRGLAEFWAAWWLALRGRRVWLMVHDVPELSGGAFFTTLLDRRGGRRLAAFLSATLGRRAERGLLQRAERVLCLSPAGARTLERAHRLTRPVQDLPHVGAVVEVPTGGRTEVLVPGYVADAADVVPLVRVAGGLPDGWTLAVGAAAPATEERVRAEAAARGVLDRVRLLGFLPETEVRASFARAAVVVRWRRDGWGGGGAFAVSGPLVAALGHGCAVVTNDSRGASHLFDEAQVVVVGDGEPGERELVAAVRALVADGGDRRRRGEAGRALVRREHLPGAIAARLVGAREPERAGAVRGKEA
ncbi:glycosyltransferase [Cellulomonas sp. C5510]|uniref:glycosyltransferase family protein n=1 Tax=Cellulomonas sp. C5510 TaxID=2871170 RepID=UPI001C93AB89|nr:glycosyltransferase [Cellulomonas sp. C5510]QZN86338.1 glycosyltransferase [Cellulomonas sp. C5510]